MFIPPVVNIYDAVVSWGTPLLAAIEFNGLKRGILSLMDYMVEIYPGPNIHFNDIFLSYI